MDHILIEVYQQMLERRHCSTDDILCEPELREEFLVNTRLKLGSDRAEGVLLRRLANLRKRSKLPTKHFQAISAN